MQRNGTKTMAYFSKGVTKDKLTMLYFLHALNVDITRDQLVSVGLQCEILPYFDMQNAINELEEVGAVAAVPRSYGQGYCVTPIGEQVLELFQEELPYSLRQTLDMHAEENRQALKHQTQYAATITDLPGGSCLVNLRAREPNLEFLRVSIVLPDRSFASQARDLWQERAADIYQSILQKLSE